MEEVAFELGLVDTVGVRSVNVCDRLSGQG